MHGLVSPPGECSRPGGALEWPGALRYSQHMTTAAPPLSIYQRRSVLRGMNPLIWRRVLGHSHTTLVHFPTILRILFAWSAEGGAPSSWPLCGR
jgi:hypothetical protein